ncbi:alpha/beta fold hydrolase [Bifidobacterium choloepi]|uniref:Alpha/beta hydrolase n=1 Tax=Bifidobacterium choloepi TaxID=2614131 RepID=A0A6I5N2G9_9BIFI|nr:alpha/beta hydrolase [Bifidobacterium choloepi]NEG70375.1 alpha/beta hydrolase [Bifidobacterium choloepi]
MTFDIVNHVYRDGEGLPLVLCHGFPVDHRMWDRCATALMELSDANGAVQYPIWAPDMPGAGDSPAVPAAEVGRIADDGAYFDALDLMADAYVDMLHAAGYDRAIWAGLSMGGYLVLDIQRRHPDAVAGIALLDTKGDADSAKSRANRIRIAAECERDRTTQPVMFFVDVAPNDSSVKKSAAYIEQFGEWIREQEPEGIAWRERMAAGRPDLNDVFGTIAEPAAVVCGLNDPSSPPAVMEPIAAQIRSGAVVTEIEDCGHFSAWERPEAVAQALHNLRMRVERRS